MNYASCHDNYTLYDQLVQTMSEDRLQSAYLQAEALVFLSEGVPFIQEGEEFMRSKLDPETGKYSGNSYNVGDFINVMDYSLKVDHLDLYEKIRSLIDYRKNQPAFRLSKREDIEKRVQNVTGAKGVVRFDVDDLTVIHSVSGGAFELDGTFEVRFSTLRNAEEKVTGSITLQPNESVVLRKVD